MIQVENFERLDEALQYDVDGIRFGSEFCERKIPSLDVLKKAYSRVKDSGKSFTYVTPRVSNAAFERIEGQLAFLNEKAPIDVVANDLGILGLIGKYSNLKPCLGRQLVYVPARSPWEQITGTEVDFLTRRRIEKIFYQTELNYSATAQFYKKIGIGKLDVDWIPRCFPYFASLVEQRFDVSTHICMVLVTLTRKCHTARFLHKEDLESCSEPCYTNAFLLRQEDLGVRFYLFGNAVFRLEEPTKKDLSMLSKRKGIEFVASIDQLKRLGKWEEVTNLFSAL